jgi:hypothetical protein
MAPGMLNHNATTVRLPCERAECVPGVQPFAFTIAAKTVPAQISERKKARGTTSHKKASIKGGAASWTGASGMSEISTVSETT